MARASATWTDTNTSHFRPGMKASDSIEDYWVTDVLQNVEYIAQTHAHREGVSGDGAVLFLNSGKGITYFVGAF